MKIYTKTGDKGSTSLVGGARVSKNDPRVHAYGTVDELISHLALLRAEAADDKYIDNIRRIQKNLMLAAAHLAADAKGAEKLKYCNDGEILFLEEQIDEMTSALPQQTAFILPGPHKASAVCHIARTVCRRAERSALALEAEPRIELCIKYLNRLSDYLFVYARHLSINGGIPDDFWAQ
ncbi:MAG: cob(I)yrinic acid a,c-diamide adenosyltransferase [Bacteroidales bacterium]|nr:cob(I)yrinic acid a,c-diamide adenosyltransferase [Bacteroidales bacterium]